MMPLNGTKKMNAMTAAVRVPTSFYNFLIMTVRLQTSIIGLTMVKCLLVGMLTWTAVLLMAVRDLSIFLLVRVHGP